MGRVLRMCVAIGGQGRYLACGFHVPWPGWAGWLLSHPHTVNPLPPDTNLHPLKPGEITHTCLLFLSTVFAKLDGGITCFSFSLCGCFIARLGEGRAR